MKNIMQNLFGALVMFSPIISGNETDSGRTTKLLVEVCRHGQRASSVIYPFTDTEADNF
jgi:hypothetical protein